MLAAAFVVSVGLATISLDYSLAGFAVCLLYLVASHPPTSPQWNRTHILLAVFALLWVIQLVRIAGMPQFRDLLGLLIIGVSSYQVTSRLEHKALANALAGCGAVLLLASVGQMTEMSPGTLILVPNDIVASLLFLPLMVIRLRRPGPARWIGVTLVGIVLSIVANSRLGILVTLSTFAVGCFPVTRPGRASMAIAIVCLGVVAVLIAVSPPVAKPLDSLHDRALIWMAAVGTDGRTLIMGHPFGTFAEFLQTSGYRGELTDRRMIPWPHSLWIESLWVGGVALLAAHIGIVVVYLRRTVRSGARVILAVSAGWLLVQTFEASWLRWWTWCFGGVWLGILTHHLEWKDQQTD